MLSSSRQRALRLFFQFLLRDIKSRYLGSFSGLLWVFLHPALLLALYTFLISGVLKARIPNISESQWLPFVALGLWPWMCFSEGLQRAAASVLEHASLLGKIALPSELLVAASVTSTFGLHLLGLFAALVLMYCLGYPVSLFALPALGLLMLQLFLLTLGIAWIVAGLQVYLRDVAQVLGQALAFMFFLTPVIYAREMMPPAFQQWFGLNPLTGYCEQACSLVLLEFTSDATWPALWIATVVALFGFALFRRLARHFEDFL
jgi:lipopolysaccharide transport system permease protein